MKFQFRMPELTEANIYGQVQQIYRYLRQLVKTLEMAFATASTPDSRSFSLAPCPGIAIRKQQCRAYGALGLSVGSATLHIQAMGGNTWIPGAKIPKELAPGQDTALAVTMPGGELIGGYIQGRDSQAPGTIMLWVGEGVQRESDCYLSFAYQEG